jgi:hypothetical protein
MIKKLWPGLVVLAFNHSYSGGGDQEDHGLRPSQAKSLHELISSSGWLVCSCHPSYVGGINRRIKVANWRWVECETLLEK